MVRRKRAMRGLPEKRIAEDELGYIGDMLRWGASVEKICDTLGITAKQFSSQMETDAELMKVVREARLMRDMDIQRAFFEAAVGGFRTTTSRRHIQKEDGSRQMEVTEKTEYVRADPKMMSLMLRNIDQWFSDKDSFEKRIALESLKIRKQLAGRDDWEPVTEKVTKLRGRVKTLNAPAKGRRRKVADGGNAETGS